MTREEAWKILSGLTEGESLLRHARTVELVMIALAVHFQEDIEKYAVTGLLHDADYEKYPELHPKHITAMLQELGENEIAHAVSGHYTKWNVPRESLLDKCIVAADEITGFIVASALIRPTKIEGLTVKSVMKKFKTSTFAASVDREECIKGAEMLGWTLEELIDFIIPVLELNKEELMLAA